MSKEKPGKRRSLEGMEPLGGMVNMHLHRTMEPRAIAKLATAKHKSGMLTPASATAGQASKSRTKACRRCKEYKPIDDFMGRSGESPKCAVCRKKDLEYVLRSKAKRAPVWKGEPELTTIKAQIPWALEDAVKEYLATLNKKWNDDNGQTA
jgi:hypothetical protein